MLKYLHCENFRKHADVKVRFTPGINAIRAANEAGKSTLIEGITYCLFGALAGLKEPVADVVSYGVPAAQLRAELGFDVHGIDYVLTRSPKGAELNWAGGRVTGQTEVTNEVERLLGTNQAMASKLMLAKQKDLGGALKEGPTAAGKMIEDLANLDLIEELAGLVRQHLPAGNTAVQESVVSALREQAQPVYEELDEIAPLQAALVAAERAHGAVESDLQQAQRELANLDLDQAHEILTNEKIIRARMRDTEDLLKQAQELAARPELAAPAEAEIEALRARIAAQTDLEAAGKLHAELKAANVEMLWDEPYAALEAAILATSTEADRLAEAVRETLAGIEAGNQERREAVSAYILASAKLEARLIKDTTCALCQKDLKDVPEVAAINNPLQQQLVALAAEHAATLAGIDEQLAALNEELFEHEKMLKQQQEHLRALMAVNTRAGQCSLLYARAEKYITLDHSVVPALWTWTGPTGAPQNYSGELARLLEQKDAAVRRAEQRQVGAVQALSAEKLLATDQAKLAALQLTDAQETLDLEIVLRPCVAELQEQLRDKESARNAAELALKLAQQQLAARTMNCLRAKQQLTVAEGHLAEMEANNLLVKKLYAARPAIADQLWSVVLAASSTYTADVRGEPSTLSRADGKFKINGRPVTGLSGSAEDVLGLGIRFALTKTFLDVDFVILDEPASACNDEREAAMLGLLATSGFAQTILVTHSELADAFADNIITL